MRKSMKNHMPAAVNGRHMLRNDILFIALLLLAVSIVGALLFFLRGEGDMVQVTVDGVLYERYPLAEDVRVEIRTGEGLAQMNVLVIRDGKAFVEQATCPDGICSAHRAISREGESIVCLPHRVVITVYTGEEHAVVVIG